MPQGSARRRSSSSDQRDGRYGPAATPAFPGHARTILPAARSPARDLWRGTCPATAPKTSGTSPLAGRAGAGKTTFSKSAAGRRRNPDGRHSRTRQYRVRFRSDGEGTRPLDQFHHRPIDHGGVHINPDRHARLCRLPWPTLSALAAVETCAVVVDWRPASSTARSG